VSTSRIKGTYALKSKKALRLVPKMLSDIDRDLEQTLKEVERGEVDVADLEWENELDLHLDKDR
jgi:hypothetical protein